MELDVRVEVRDEYLKWIDEHALPIFREHDIEVSSSARYLLALSLQVQVDEGFACDQQTAERRAESFLRLIRDRYRFPYLEGGGELSFNIALHLLVDLNHTLLLFPKHAPTRDSWC